MAMLVNSQGICAPTSPSATETAGRLRNLLSQAALDCACRERLEAALTRFTEFEESRASHRAILDARQQRLRIATLAALLEELESLAPADSDDSVFLEFALLFDDVAASALAGAAAMRSLQIVRE